MALMTRATDAGMHTEQLAGRTQQRFFRPEEESRFTYPHAFEVDYGKRAEFDAADLEPTQINLKLRELMSQGYGTIVLKNPGAKHSIAVGILNRLNLRSRAAWAISAAAWSTARISGSAAASAGRAPRT